MSKEVNEKGHVLAEDVMGEVRIADAVVANIASIAAREIDGVASIAGTTTEELMSLVGVKSEAKGVKIRIVDDVVSVGLILIMKYGVNIPTTCKQVQEKVKTTIENMTGLTVDIVKIRVSGMEF